MINPADYAPLIRKIARRYYYIEDAGQEAWLCCCEAAAEYDQRRNVRFSTFLMARLRAHFVRLLRENQKRRRMLAAVRNEHLTVGQRGRNATDGGRPGRINIAQLPPRTREAARCVLSGLSQSETARRMGITPQGVGRLLRRAGKRRALTKNK